MTRNHCDVLVLGGGPSGCAGAITVARAGLSTILLERSDYSRVRIGESLAPETAPWLARMGLNATVQALNGLVSPGVQSLWGGSAPAETDFLFNPFGPGLHVDRARFDAALACHANQCGVAVFCKARPSRFRQSREGWELTATIAGVPRTFTSHWIVDATGRSAWFVRRHADAPRVVDRLIGLVVRATIEHSTDRRLALEAVPNGWFYFAPLPEGRGVATLLTDRDLLGSSADVESLWRDNFAQSRLITTRFRPRDEDRPRVVNASTQYCGRVAGANWVAVGDAAAAIDPLSGSGICQSLASGFEAARSILAAISGDTEALMRYQKSIDESVHRSLSEQARLYAMVADWRDRPFWRRRSAHNWNESLPSETVRKST